MVYPQDENVIDFSESVKYSLKNGNRSLYIANTTTDEGGSYSCNAKNSIAESKMEYVLDILTPPKVIGGVVETKFISKKDEAMFIECPVTGNPTPEIYWTAESNDSSDQRDPKVISTDRILVSSDINITYVASF